MQINLLKACPGSLTSPQTTPNSAAWNSDFVLIRDSCIGNPRPAGLSGLSLPHKAPAGGPTLRVCEIRGLEHMPGGHTLQISKHLPAFDQVQETLRLVRSTALEGSPDGRSHQRSCGTGLLSRCWREPLVPSARASHSVRWGSLPSRSFAHGHGRVPKPPSATGWAPKSATLVLVAQRAQHLPRPRQRAWSPPHDTESSSSLHGTADPQPQSTRPREQRL